MIGKVNCSDTATRLDQCDFSGPGEDVGCSARDRSAGVLCFRTTGRVKVFTFVTASKSNVSQGIQLTAESLTTHSSCKPLPGCEREQLPLNS